MRRYESSISEAMIVASYQCISKCFLLLKENFPEYATKHFATGGDDKEAGLHYLELVKQCF